MQTGTTTLNSNVSPTVQVVATTGDGTEAALRTAIPLAKGFGAKLRIVLPRIVPYPMDVDSPSESAEFFVRRYTDMATHLGGDAAIDVCLCRSLDEVLDAVAARGAQAVVVGGPCGRWLTSPEERFASALARRGVHVIFASCGLNRTQRRTFVSAAAMMVLVLASVFV